MPEFLEVEDGQIITPAAAQILSDAKVEVRRIPADSRPAAGTAALSGKAEALAARPGPAAVCRYVSAADGGCYEQKPEHLTQLHGKKLVAKDHPRIVLRGALDQLQAEILILQDQVGDCPALVADLGDVLGRCRNILKAEVLEQPLEDTRVIGLNDAELRDRSHHPKQHFGIEHVLPEHGMDKVVLDLNLLRTRVRATEICAVTAFRGDCGVERPDLIQALNRMSSAVYVMMLKHMAGMYR